MSDICFVRPSNDAAATTLANMANQLVSNIPSGHALHDLTGTSATRTAVETELSACRLIVFWGHGMKSRLQGASTDLVDLSNVSQAQGHLIIAIACWSADTLGSTATTSSGVDAYLGFNEQFGCLAGDPDGEFGAAVVKGIEEIIVKGNDMSATLATMQRRFDDVFAYYKTGKGSGTSDSVLGWLLADWDKTHARLTGNVSSTL